MRRRARVLVDVGVSQSQGVGNYSPDCSWKSKHWGLDKSDLWKEWLVPVLFKCWLLTSRLDGLLHNISFWSSGVPMCLVCMTSGCLALIDVLGFRNKHILANMSFAWSKIGYLFGVMVRFERLVESQLCTSGPVLETEQPVTCTVKG